MILYTNTIFDTLQKYAESLSDTIAIKQTDGKKRTYKELWEDSNSIALHLMEKGFRPGDKVLFLVRPSIDAVELILAVIRLGGVLVLADIGMGSDVFRGRVEHANPQWVFAESLFIFIQKVSLLRKFLRKRSIDIPEIPGLGGRNVVITGKWLPGIRKSGVQIQDLLNKKTTDYTVHQSDPEQEVLLVFTSGTTELPKGVIHTLRAVQATVEYSTDILNPQKGACIYGGYLHTIIPALLTKSLAVIPVEKFSAERFITHATKYNITGCFLLPSELEAILKYIQQHTIPFPQSINKIVLGSAPIYVSFLKRIEPFIPVHVSIECIYGMTEALPVASIRMREKIAYLGPGDIVGKPFLGVTVEIEDQELIIKGRNLFKGYLGQDPAEYHKTGDAAYIDQRGNIVLMGRFKDMIIRDHYNIYPSLYEPTISQIEGIHSCALIGVYNEDRSDEDIYLIIEKDSVLDDDRLEKYIRGELIAGVNSVDIYAIPDKIIFMKLPLSGRSKKIDKKALREMFRKS